MSDFEGHAERECGEHRTLGGRAWCFDCSTYCYPEQPCPGCELPGLRAERDRYREALREIDEEVAHGSRDVLYLKGVARAALEGSEDE